MSVMGGWIGGFINVFVFDVFPSDRGLVVEGRQSAEGHPIGPAALFKRVAIIFIYFL